MVIVFVKKKRSANKKTTAKCLAHAYTLQMYLVHINKKSVNLLKFIAIATSSTCS